MVPTQQELLRRAAASGDDVEAVAELALQKEETQAIAAQAAKEQTDVALAPLYDALNQIGQVMANVAQMAAVNAAVGRQQHMTDDEEIEALGQQPEPKDDEDLEPPAPDADPDET